MIKFFRKIRQKLLEQNRVSKYLLYAFGEIILVVIGILIAIQINSLYNSKLKKTENKLIIKRMLNEVENNISRLNYLDSYSKLQTRAYSYLSYKNSESDLDSCYTIILRGIQRSDIEFLVKHSSYNFSSLSTFRSVYDEMLNTGKIYTLKSDSLSTKIDNYYKLLERESFYVNRQLDQVQRSYENCKHGWMYFKQVYEINPEKAIQANLWLFDQNSLEYKNLSNYVYKAKSITIRTRDRIKNSIEESKELYKSINKYLND